MSIEGKICMITGANSGIGKVTAFELVEMGAIVIMVCRDKNRGESAQKDIMEATGKELDLLLCDLSSIESIKNLVSVFESKYQNLHILINNAGVMLSKRQTSVDNFEMNFAVNHLAPFLLTNLLLDVLKKSSPSRIINVSSAAHRFGKIDFNDLQSERKKSRFMGLYGSSKLALMLLSYELSRKLEGSGVTVNTLHPGVVNTQLGNGDRTKPKKGLSRRFLLSPEKGAETTIFLASSSEVEGISGKYYIKKEQHRSSKESYNEDSAKKLWEITEKMVNL